MKKILLAAALIFIVITTFITISKKLTPKESSSLGKTHSAPVSTVIERAKATEEIKRSTERKNKPSNNKSTASPQKNINLSVYDQEQIAKKMSQHIRNKRDRLQKERSKLEIENITRDLNLDEEQQSELQDYMDYKDGILSEYGVITKGDLNIEKLLSVLKGDPILNALHPHLSDEQNQALAIYQQNKKANEANDVALDRLSKIQDAVALHPDQRDAIHQQYADLATHAVNNKSDARIITDYLNYAKNSDGISSRPLSENRRNKMIQEQVNELSSILSDAQLKLYQSHLETHGPRRSTVTIKLVEAPISQ